MRKVARCFQVSLKLLVLGILSAWLITLQYILRTPQPLTSVLSGEDRLYKWIHGHIFYKIVGDQDAPPLVLLHSLEIGASSYEMRGLIASLAQHYRVYALDLLGFGLSDRPKIAYTADLYVNLCRDFLVDVVRQPATLLASGLSCNYSIAIAASHPDLCHRLVLLSPVAVFKPRERHRWLSLLAENPTLGLVLYSLLTMHVVLREVVALRQGLGYQHVPAKELNDISAAAHQIGAEYAVLALMAGKLDLPVSDQLRMLQQPNLTIWGTRHVSVASLPQISAQTHVVSIQDVGLRIQEACPDKVVASILAWRQMEEKPAEVPVGTKTSSVVANGSVVEEHAAEPVSEAPAVLEKPSPSPTIEAYCVKCRKKRMMQNATKIITKNGRSAMEGTCPVCGTKLFRFISG